MNQATGDNTAEGGPVMTAATPTSEQAAEPRGMLDQTVLSHAPALLGALLLVAGGAAALWAARSRSDKRIMIPVVGLLSQATLAVVGMSAVIGAYHVVVYALGIEGFRAPPGILLAVIGAAVGISLATDAFESRHAPDGTDAEEQRRG